MMDVVCGVFTRGQWLEPVDCYLWTGWGRWFRFCWRVKNHIEATVRLKALHSNEDRFSSTTYASETPPYDSDPDIPRTPTHVLTTPRGNEGPAARWCSMRVNACWTLSTERSARTSIILSTRRTSCDRVVEDARERKPNLRTLPTDALQRFLALRKDPSAAASRPLWSARERISIAEEHQEEAGVAACGEESGRL